MNKNIKIYIQSIFLASFLSISLFSPLFFLIAQSQKPIDKYFEYPTETWLIEKQDYFGSFLEWNFVLIDGQSGDKRIWVFSWIQLPFITVFNNSGFQIEIIENPIRQIRQSIDNQTALKKIYDSTPIFSNFKTWGDFKSDVSKLDRYPIIPEDKEEFIGLHTKIDILNFDEGSFLVSFKDKWKLGKKIMIGFGSTIVYNGGTNTITATGGTELSSLDFWDLWNSSDVNGWDVVNNTCNTQFKFWCKIQIGDGSTETWFADTMKQIVFADGISGTFLKITENATFRLGTLDNATEKITTDGCSLIYSDTSTLGTFDGDSENGVILLYSSQIMSLTRWRQIKCYRWGNTSKIYNTQFLGDVRLWGDFNAEIYNVISIGTKSNTIGIYQVTGDINQLLVSDHEYNADLGWTTESITINNLTARDPKTSSFFCRNLNHPIYLVNPDIDVWTFTWVTSSDKVYRQYTFDLKVIDPDGTSINNAIVSLFDNNNDEVFSVLTDAQGEIIQQTISRGYYDQANGNTLQDYSLHTLNIYKDNYQPYVMNITFSQKTNWEIALSPTESVGSPLFIILLVIVPMIVVVALFRRR